jgi:hypothetical protein
MPKFLLILLLFFVKNLAFANGEPFPIGAKSWGMGNATVAISDRFSIFNNPAGLGFLKDNFVSSSYHARYEIAGLATVSLSGNYVSKLANFGLSFQRFGDKLYNENMVGFAIGKATERVSLGLKVNYFQAAIENLSDKKTLLTEFGVMAKLTSKIQMGFHAYNLTGASLYASQRIPTVLKLGVSFTPTKQVLLAAEVEKNLDYQGLITKVGLEYEIVPKVFFRTGITSQFRTAHFGFGFISKHFYFDYAASTHTALGLSHHLGLSYMVGSQ